MLALDGTSVGRSLCPFPCLGRKAVVMEESLIKPVDETTWYENDQPIREFLESFRKPVILEPEEQAEDLSWAKIMKNSIQN